MKSRPCRYILFSVMLTSMSLSASQHDNNRTYQREQNASVFFLVNGSSSYNGDTLSLGGRQFDVSWNGQISSGLYFFYGDLLLLWDRSQSEYQFIKIEAIDNSIWTSCWANSPQSARSCDSSSQLVHIFSDENRAANYQNNAEPDPAVVPSPAEPDVEPAPEPAPADSDDVDTPADSDATDPPVAQTPQPPADIASVACGAPSENLKAALLQATNDSRSQSRSCGVDTYQAASALVWNDSLARAAQQHSEDMSNNNFFSHSGSDGLQVWDRANAQNYQYRYIGENIAAGQGTVGQVQDGWINSPGHCANIMNDQIVEMGAACVEDSNSDYRTYWTVVVGRPQ